MPKTYITNMTVPDSNSTPQTYYFQLDSSIWEAWDSSIDRRIAEAVTSAVQYFGTAKVSGTPAADFTFISSSSVFGPDPSQRQKEGKGDFYRWVGDSVTPSSNNYWADGTQTTLSQGDLLVVANTAGSNYARYFVLNTEEWQQNTKTQDGYVPAPTAQKPQRLWATDSTGEPGWRLASVTTTPEGKIHADGADPDSSVYGIASVGSMTQISDAAIGDGSHTFTMVTGLTSGSAASIADSTFVDYTFKAVGSSSTVDVIKQLKNHETSATMSTFNGVGTVSDINITANDQYTFSKGSLYGNYSGENLTLNFTSANLTHGNSSDVSSFYPVLTASGSNISTMVTSVGTQQIDIDSSTASRVTVAYKKFTPNTPTSSSGTATLHYKNGSVPTQTAKIVFTGKEKKNTVIPSDNA